MDEVFPFLDLPKDFARAVLESWIGKPFQKPEFPVFGNFESTPLVTTFLDNVALAYSPNFYSPKTAALRSLLGTCPSLCLSALSAIGPEDYPILIDKGGERRANPHIHWLIQHRMGQVRQALGSVRPFQLKLNTEDWRENLALLQLAGVVETDLANYRGRPWGSPPIPAKMPETLNDLDFVTASLPGLALRSLKLSHSGSGPGAKQSKGSLPGLFKALEGCTTLKELVLSFGRQHCPLDSLSLPTSLEKLQLEGGLGPNNAGWQGPLEKILKTGVRLQGLGINNYDFIPGSYLSVLSWAPESLTRLDVDRFSTSLEADLQHLARLTGLKHLAFSVPEIKATARLANLVKSLTRLTMLDLATTHNDEGSFGKAAMGFPPDKTSAALQLFAACPDLNYLNLSALGNSSPGSLDLAAMKAVAEGMGMLSDAGGRRVITLEGAGYDHFVFLCGDLGDYSGDDNDSEESEDVTG